MSLNIQEASVCFFLGSILTSYLWNIRYSIFRNAKQFTYNQTRSIWNKSTQFIQKQKRSLFEKKIDKRLEEMNQRLENQFFKRQEDKLKQSQVKKQKKIKKEKKKKNPQNLKRSIKRYQDWFLSKNSLNSYDSEDSRVSQKKTLQKVDLDILKQRILDYEVKLRDQEQDGVNALQQFLEIEQVQQYGNVLGYNPFIAQQQPNNNQRIYELRRISSIQ